MLVECGGRSIVEDLLAAVVEAGRAVAHPAQWPRLATQSKTMSGRPSRASFTADLCGLGLAA